MDKTCSSCKHYEIDGDRGWCPKLKGDVSWSTPACPKHKQKEAK